MIVTLKERLDDDNAKEDYVNSCEYGKYYFVYGVLKDDKDDSESYLINIYGKSTVYDIPSKFFRVVEDSLPSDWIESEYTSYDRLVRINTFPEWANDKYFYDKLMNEDQNTVNIFKRYAAEYEGSVEKYRAR